MFCSEKWDVFLEKASEAGAIDNGTVAQDASQAGGLWRIRESITESLGKNGVVYKYDLSLPVVHLYKLVEETQERIGKPETGFLMESDPWYTKAQQRWHVCLEPRVVFEPRKKGKQSQVPWLSFGGFVGTKDA